MVGNCGDNSKLLAVESEVEASKCTDPRHLCLQQRLLKIHQCFMSISYKHTIINDDFTIVAAKADIFQS